MHKQTKRYDTNDEPNMFRCSSCDGFDGFRERLKPPNAMRTPENLLKDHLIWPNLENSIIRYMQEVQSTGPPVRMQGWESICWKGDSKKLIEKANN